MMTMTLPDQIDGAQVALLHRQIEHAESAQWARMYFQLGRAYELARAGETEQARALVTAVRDLEYDTCGDCDVTAGIDLLDDGEETLQIDD
jgi:hypothetical protein